MWIRIKFSFYSWFSKLSSYITKNKVTPKLSKLAIFIEQKRVNETVGSQDQVAVAYGGINNIIFKKIQIFM